MLKYKLIAEVLRQWKADPEERALGEYILHLMGWTLEDVNKRTVPEITDELTRFAEGKISKEEVVQEVQETNETQEENEVLEVSAPVFEDEILSSKKPVGRKRQTA